MSTSQTPFLTEILEGEVIPLGKLAYFRERLRNRLHQLVIREFVRQEDIHRLTRAELARRIGRAPEQITRWLGAPGNWTLDTVSDLMLGMGTEPRFDIEHLADRIAAQAAAAASGLPKPSTDQKQPVTELPARPRPIVPQQEGRHANPFQRVRA
jgi:hypothetical protein